MYLFINLYCNSCRYYYEVKKGGNDALVNKKERRRLSLERPFKTDYINYRQNFKLKDCIGDKGTPPFPFFSLSRSTIQVVAQHLLQPTNYHVSR
jgi:hypothetical protein